MPDQEKLELTQEQLNAAIAGAVEKALKERESKPAEPEKDLEIEKKAAELYEQTKNADAEKKSIEHAVRFNLSIEKYIEENKDVLPPECAKIVEASKDKKFSSEVLKANEIRKGIMNLFLSKAENVDCLPPSQKELVAEYKSLTTDEQEKQSAKFWNLVEVGVNNRVLMRRAEQFGKTANAGGAGDYRTDYEKRFLDNRSKQNG